MKVRAAAVGNTVGRQRRACLSRTAQRLAGRRPWPAESRKRGARDADIDDWTCRWAIRLVPDAVVRSRGNIAKRYQRKAGAFDRAQGNDHFGGRAER